MVIKYIIRGERSFMRSNLIFFLKILYEIHLKIASKERYWGKSVLLIS